MFQEKPVFPFSAIINQHALKLALLLNAIDPSIGGALLTGPKGAGKSLTVYALPEILPTIDVVTDCVFNCSPHDPTNMCSSCRSRFTNGKLVTAHRKMPLIQIPIGATEDRIIGTLDVEKALQQGTRVLHPGLLSEANQGILYIDEVNLLPDHLIDTIIDAASSGWNVVEREGISITHPSRFILIGSMNPEEGELRPQILDRFGLHAKAKNLENVEERIRVIQVNQDFRNDPLAVRAKYQSQQEDITHQVEAARQLLPNVHVSLDIITSVSKMCINLEVDGHRPDIVMIKTAKAYAAFHGRDEVNLEDLTAASQLTLTHRTRKSGLTPPPTNQEIEEAFKITPIAKASQTWKDYFQKFISQKSIVNVLTSIVGLLGRLFNLLFPFLLLTFFLMMTFIVLSSQFHTTDLFSLFIITLLIALSISAWIGRRKKRTIPRLLDFSRITSEQTSGPQTIIEDNDKPRTVQRDLEYQGGSPLESGEKTLSSVLKPENPVKLPSTSLSHIRPDERPRRGKYYLVGKRAKIVTSAARGRYVWHEQPKQRPWDVAFGPTVRAAAPYQLSRHLQGLAIAIEPEDLRVKMREYRAPFSILLLVDMSLSMATSIANLDQRLHSDGCGYAQSVEDFTNRKTTQ
jgi:Mg-chelatase subunit ChlI